MPLWCTIRSMIRSFLTLRDLGVVHIKETNSVMDNERLQELLAERKQINTLMRYFKNLHAAEKDVSLPRPVS